MTIREARPAPRIPFEEVVEALDVHRVAEANHRSVRELLYAATMPENRVVGDTLYTHTGVTFQVPSDDDIEAFKLEEMASEQRLRDTLGLQPEISLPGFQRAVRNHSFNEKMKAQGRPGLASPLSRSWMDSPLSALTVADFFKSVQALSQITGDRYDVRGNEGNNYVEEIGPETDIDELLRVGLAFDITYREMQNNPPSKAAAPDRFSRDALQRTYGISITQ